MTNPSRVLSKGRLAVLGSSLRVESARIASKTIEENLKATRLDDRAEIIRQDVREYLRRTDTEPFEYVYIAPPQYKNLWQETLRLLDEHPEHVEPDGIVIVQIDPTEKQDITLQTLVPYDERRYGNTLLWFFEKPGE